MFCIDVIKLFNKSLVITGKGARRKKVKKKEPKKVCQKDSILFVFITTALLQV